MAQVAVVDQQLISIYQVAEIAAEIFLMRQMAASSLDQRELEVNREMLRVDLSRKHQQFLLVEHPERAEVYSVH
jgi:hypothetical protein